MKIYHFGEEDAPVLMLLKAHWAVVPLMRFVQS